MEILRSVTRGLILFLLVTTIPGCWDKRELEEQAFIMSICIDKGKAAEYMWTFRIAIPSALAGGEGGGGGGSDSGETSSVVSIESNTLFGALNLLNTFIDRRANLMHAKIILIGEQVAREDPVPLRSLVRYREIRRNVYVIVAKGKARDILLANKPKLEKNPAAFFETIMLNSSFTGLTPNTQLHDYLIAGESLAMDPVANLVGKTGGLNQKSQNHERVTAPFVPGEIPRKGDTPIEIIGVAVFRGAKMVGELTGSDNRTMAILNDKFNRGFMSVPDPLNRNKEVALELRAGSPPDISVIMGNGKPVININLSMEADYLSIQSDIDYTKPEKMAIFEAYMKQELSKLVIQTVKKTQKMGSDIFGLGNQARKLYPTFAQWEEAGWLEKYPQAELKVKVDFHIRRIGIQYNPSTMNH